MTRHAILSGKSKPASVHGRRDLPAPPMYSLWGAVSTFSAPCLKLTHTLASHKGLSNLFPTGVRFPVMLYLGSLQLLVKLV